MQQFHHRDLGPMLDDFAILETVDVDLAPVHAFAGGGLAHQGPGVGGDCGTPLHDFVTGGDQVFFSNNDVWKRAIHHDPYLAEPLKADGHRGAEMMDEIGIEEVTDAIHVMLVLEDPGELPDGIFVGSSWDMFYSWFVAIVL